MDLLRVLSMFFIVLGHSFMFGIRNNTDLGTFHTNSVTDILTYILLQGAYVFTSTGVNCFVLLSGYFLIQRTSFRISLLKIWIQTVFYSVCLAAIACIVNHESLISCLDFHLLSPFPTEEYWFIAPYMALSLLAPFLSRLGSVLNQKTYLILLLLLLILFFRYPFGAHFTDGMDLGWFIVLFFIGGYLKRFNLPRWFCARRGLWLGIAASLAFIFLVTKNIIPIVMNHDSYMVLQIMGNNSLTLITSVCLFACFMTMKGRAPWITKLSTYAPYTLGIYLIHEHSLVRHYLWDIWFPQITQHHIFLFSIIFSCAVFCLCIMIDYIRKRLFQISGLNKLIQ